jgi:DNA processing protein
LGTPLDRVYPTHHKQLQRHVGQQGLLLTEHASGSRIRPGHFAARNRLLVLFARALVVVECPERSGALISARLASVHQCPVWSVPGDARRWSCRGSNALLLDQAAPLLQSGCLLEALGPGPLLPKPSRASDHAVLEAIGAGASIHELVERLDMTPGALATRLLAMEKRGDLQCESGFRWRRCTR